MRCHVIEKNLGRDDVDIRFVEYGHSEPTHIHGGIELAYVLSGQGENIINDEIIRSKHGTIIIMDYNCVHNIRVWETMKYYNILFRASFLNENFGRDVGLKEILKKYFKYDMENDFLYAEIEDEETAQKFENLFYEILSEGIDKKERYAEMIRCHLDEIINLLLRNVYKDNNDVDLLLSQVIDYIGNNSNQNLQLEDVANKFHYKPKYLSSRLKDYCGLSFKQLLMRKRLDKVIYFLCQTDDSIDDISRKCGFTNKTYFYDVFEKTYGIKPKFIREYRKNYEKFLYIKSEIVKLLN